MRNHLQRRVFLYEFQILGRIEARKTLEVVVEMSLIKILEFVGKVRQFFRFFDC
jgi:hypothetical protein